MLPCHLRHLRLRERYTPLGQRGPVLLSTVVRRQVERVEQRILTPQVSSNDAWDASCQNRVLLRQLVAKNASADRVKSLLRGSNRLLSLVRRHQVLLLLLHVRQLRQLVSEGQRRLRRIRRYRVHVRGGLSNLKVERILARVRRESRRLERSLRLIGELHLRGREQGAQRLLRGGVVHSPSSRASLGVDHLAHLLLLESL